MKKTRNFYIKTQTCKKCGFCINVCPALVIGENSEGMPYFKENFLEICLSCGQCMSVCPTKSIFANNMDYENNMFDFSENDVFFSLLEKRRSVRHFKPTFVKNEEIEKIIKAMSYAPHGAEKNNVEITIVNKRDKILKILPEISLFYDKLKKWLHNPIMKKIIEKKLGKSKISTLINHVLPRIEKGVYKNISYNYDGITRGAHTLFIFHANKESEEHYEDAFVLVTYAMLSAQALNLGACIIGLVAPALNKSKKLKEYLKIPSENKAIISMILGYPKYKYKRGIKRSLKNVNIIE